MLGDVWMTQLMGRPRAVGWTTVTLPPGNYELVCNLGNHRANGRYQALVVS